MMQLLKNSKIFRRKHIGVNLLDLGFVNGFLDTIPKAKKKW